MQRRHTFVVFFFTLSVLITLLNIPTAYANASGSAWDLNDVSILYPLPSSINEMGEMIQLSDIGRGGPLIPNRYLERTPALSQFQNQIDERRSLRVVAVRIDPCFADEALVCRRQIRLSWQPLVGLPDGRVTSIDAALHSFYDLSEEEFSNFLSELSEARRLYGFSSRGWPLQIHPVLRAQGLNGAFARVLKNLILKYAGDDNLRKLTFMVVRGPEVFWGFGGYEIDANGVTTPVLIPRMGSLVLHQSFVNHSQAGDDFIRAILSPTPIEGERLDLFIRGSAKLTQSGISEEEIVRALRAGHMAENPGHHNPNTLDCVSCHLAQSVLDFGERLFPSLAVLARTPEAVYKNDEFNLSQAGSGMGGAAKPWHTRNLRAFGYFGSTPAISRRVIHESAEAARVLNAYPKF